jgi:hypothetical protein
VAGWANWAVCARARKRKGLRPARLRAERGERERERGRGKNVFVFFVYILFNFFFKHSNFNQTKSMHWNHDAQALIISKLF